MSSPAAEQRLAVVLATRDRAELLLPTLARLRGLPERPRVIVVDNGSGDETVPRVRGEHPEIELIPLGRNHGAAARTIGVYRATEPYIAFCDDDSWWAPGALTRASDLFDRHPRLALIAARVLAGPGQDLDPTSAGMAEAPLGQMADLPGPSVLGFLCCGAVVRRTAYLAVGGFHERLGVGGEEQLLALDIARQGLGLAYVHDVVSYHRPPPRRDGGARRRVMVRNDLWSAWLRRPARVAGRVTARHARRALHDPTIRAGAIDALRGLPWVLRERRPLPPALERDVRALER